MFSFRLSVVIVVIQRSEFVFPAFYAFELTAHKIKNIFDFCGVLIVYVVDKFALSSSSRKLISAAFIILSAFYLIYQALPA